MPRERHEEVLARFEGGSLEIGFKGSLTDCLNTMDETLIVSFNDLKSPAMFKESDGSAKAAVCLPMLMASNK